MRWPWISECNLRIACCHEGPDIHRLLRACLRRDGQLLVWERPEAIGATYAEWKREQVVESFGAQQEFNNSFHASLHEAPNDWQFFLHGAALKDCVPYGWSYRRMGYYEIPPNVAINVVPGDWLRQCGIERE